MDDEVRLLLYAVALGSGVGLASIVRRRAAMTLWFHTGTLAALLVTSTVALLFPSLRGMLGVPAIAGFFALSLAPSLIVLGARRCARERSFHAAAGGLWTGAALLGFPGALLSEARLYSALAASERGRVDDARRRLLALVATGGLAGSQGGTTLAEALPLAGARRWQEALDVIDAAPSSAIAVLGIEARASAEVGDLPRALRACSRLVVRPDIYLVAARGVLAAAGRVEFLQDAEVRHLSVLRGPRGTADLAIARALEARGDCAPAHARYAAAARRGRGVIARDARLGLARLDEAAPRLVTPDNEATDGLVRLERQVEMAHVAGRDRALPRPTATIALTAITFAISAALFAYGGDDAFTLLSAGALSAPLVRADGEWWRLFSAMLLHGGWLHLVLNLACILPVGVLVERRMGAARTLIVYFGSGVLGSLASVYINGTQIGVGASGAAMGLIGALLVLLMRRPGLFTPIERKRWLSTLWLGVGATAAIGVLEADFIDNAAHGAGALGGALLALAILPVTAARAGGDSRVRRACVRVAAALLTGLAVVATVEAARSMHTWEGHQEVRAAGARATLPGWLRLTPTRDGGVVAERKPAEIAILIGSSPAVALRPTALLDASGELRRLFDAAGAPDAVVDELKIVPRTAAEAERLGPDWYIGVRFFVIRNGDAFALVRLPVGREAEDAYAFVLDDLRRTLAPTD